MAVEAHKGAVEGAQNEEREGLLTSSADSHNFDEEDPHLDPLHHISNFKMIRSREQRRKRHTFFLFTPRVQYPYFCY